MMRVIELARKILKALVQNAAHRSPDRIRAALLSIHKYRHTFGRYPNVFFPKGFNEKVQARKLFDRRPILSTWVDKVAVRDYVNSTSGLGLLPVVYYVTSDPSSIPFDDLPDRYVVKASHGSGWVEIIRDGASVDREALIETCRGWLSSNYFEQNLELIYKDVPPRILIEEFLDGGNGEPPADIKFYVFGGVVRFIQVDVARFGQHQRAIFDRNWARVPVRLSVDLCEGDIARPVLLDQMIRYAEELSGSTDFVRVDLYEARGQIYFGEMTPTSGNGFNHFAPTSYDAVFGSHWTMPTILPHPKLSWKLPGFGRQTDAIAE